MRPHNGIATEVQIVVVGSKKCALIRLWPKVAELQTGASARN